MLKACYYKAASNNNGTYVWEISPVQKETTGWLNTLENNELEEYLRSLGGEYPSLYVNLLNEGNIVLEVVFKDFYNEVLWADIRWVK